MTPCGKLCDDEIDLHPLGLCQLYSHNRTRSARVGLGRSSQPLTPFEVVAEYKLRFA